MRVVSLVPSATETIVAFGITPVGCTRFCDLDGVPRVGGTKRVDIDAVVALAPDLVVVNDEENRIEDADALVARGLRLHDMSPRSVADVGPAVISLASVLAVEVPEPFADWTTWMTATGRSQQAVAFVPVWRRPYMSLAADTYGSSLLAHVGIGNAFADAGERYPEVDLAVVAQRDPDIALLPSEPYEFTAAHLPEVQAALPQSRVALVDGRDLFWWGIRTPAAVERLSTLV